MKNNNYHEKIGNQQDTATNLVEALSLDEALSYGDYFMINALPRNNPQLSVTEYGWEYCSPDKKFGPYIRKNYILHFVTQGEGYLYVDSVEHPVHENQFFLVPPDRVSYYCSENKNPWRYYWVGFDGLEALTLMELCGLLKDNIFVVDATEPELISSLMKNLMRNNHTNAGDYCIMVGLLYQILGAIINSNTVNEKEYTQYIQQSINYINDNFSDNITIQSIADNVGLERSYFFRLFKKCMKMSPKDYLINARLASAYNLIISKDIPLNEVAQKSGFGDYAHFTTYFKKKYSLTPRELRNSMTIHKI